MQQYSTAVVNCPARKVFAPMFRARWQNMQNLVNDSAYLDRIPAAYKTYYIAYVKQWLDWSRGFVPQLHRQDFFSVGMGYTVCDIMTKMCMSGGYRFHAASSDTQSFMEKWCEDDLNNIFNKMFFDANAGGNVLLCVTPIDGELYPSVIPINRAVFQIGRTGRITDALILNRFVSGDTAYYAEEARTISDGVAYMRIRLAEASPITSPSFGTTWKKEVPRQIRAQWEYCYGDIKPGAWYEMPKKLRGIGLYNVKNKAVASAMTDMPGYSDSTLHTCLDILYSIDYNYTQSQVDQYIGKSTVLVPKQMGGKVIQGQKGTLTEGMSFREVEARFETQPLDEQFYKQIGDNNVDGKPMQPIVIQPSLRGEERRFIRDSDIELLAGKVGIAASTLASHLAGGGTKTDDQINAETSIDEKTVGNKRTLANKAINAMLSDVAYFYGLDDDITIQWGRSDSNSARENDELMRDYQAGTLTLREYLKQRWPDKNESEIEKLASELEAAAQRKAEEAANKRKEGEI